MCTSRRTRSVLSIAMRALPALLTVAALGCTAPGGASRREGHSRATASVPGRRIEAAGVGHVAVQAVGDRAVVSVASHNVTVERDRVLLDGAELAKLPADAAEVHVTAADGELTVTADGKAIAKTPLTR